MTKPEADQVLKDPATHKLVYQILKLASTRDIVDAINDIDLAGEILKAKLRKSLYGPSWSVQEGENNYEMVYLSSSEFLLV